MPGDEEIVHHLGPQRVCGHLPIAQPNHQNGLLPVRAGQKLQDFFRQAAGNLPVIVFVRLHHGGSLHGHIDAHGLSHGLGGVPGVYHHFRHPDVLFLVIVFLHSDAPQLTVRLADALPGFQRQICPHLKIVHRFLHSRFDCYDSFLFWSIFLGLCLDKFSIIY